MTDSVEYLLIDVDSDTEEVLLSVDGRIVSECTSAEVLLFLSAPSVVPDVREFGVTDSNDCIHEVMNGELEYRSAVATFRRTSIMGECSRLADRITVEDVITTFQYILFDEVVVWLVNVEYERMDAVATVSSCGGILVRTCFGEILSLIEVIRTFADSYYSRVEDLFVHIDLDTEEVLLSVDGGIVSIDTGCVESLFVTAPTVMPDVRYIVVADIYYCIYKRMNSELENSRAVAILRSTSAVVDGSALTERITVEDVIAAFEYMLIDDTVVRLVNGEDERMDAVASVSCCGGVLVRTCFGEVSTHETVVRAFADSYARGVIYRFADVDLDTEEVFLTVDGGIIAFDTGGEVPFFVIAPTVMPYERQIVRADVHDGIHDRMNGELYNRRAVTTFRRASGVCTCGRLAEGVSEEDVISTFEDVLFDEVVVRLVNGEDERMDAVTTVSCSQRIVVDTCFGEVSSLVLVVRAFADSYARGVLYRLVHNEL